MFAGQVSAGGTSSTTKVGPVPLEATYTPSSTVMLCPGKGMVPLKYAETV